MEFTIGPVYVVAHVATAMIPLLVISKFIIIVPISIAETAIRMGTGVEIMLEQRVVCSEVAFAVVAKVMRARPIQVLYDRRLVHKVPVAILAVPLIADTVPAGHDAASVKR